MRESESGQGRTEPHFGSQEPGMAVSSLRVLHCPAMVGGNPQGLARAERSVGLQSLSVAISQTRFKYTADQILSASRRGIVSRELARWRLLWKAVRDFDVIHFNSGQSIMPQRIPGRSVSHPGSSSLSRQCARKVYNLYSKALELRDLPLLKGRGKGIAVTYQGNDARQGDYCRANFSISPAGAEAAHHYSPDSDAMKRERIAVFEEYADRIYALNPDLLHVLPKRAQFLPYGHINLDEWCPQAGDRTQRPIVVHAPSRPEMKGTRHVLDAVAQLKDEGVDFEFVLAEGLPHHEMKDVYAQSDLVVDQLFCGWYGAVAVEAMALGKPVICYIRDDDLGFIPDGMRRDLPIIRADPGSIQGVLRTWLGERRGELEEVGRRSRGYVETWHDPILIASRLRRDYEAIMRSKGLD